MVIGATGMLGGEVAAQLAAHGADPVRAGRAEADLTDPAAVASAVADCRPDIVVNCAAWTAVDLAESEEEAALEVNGRGPGHLARACAAVGSRLLHVSTDYVFAGAPADAGRAYPEDFPTDPRTAYGRTKLAGERAVLAGLPGRAAVVRTSWLYGRDSGGFVHTMARLAREAERTVEVVDDQHGQPSWAPDVAARLIALGALPADRAHGVFHATGAGRTTWHALAREVFRLTGHDPERVRAIDSSRLNRAAVRPAWSVLGHERWAAAGLGPMRHWQAALTEALAAAHPPPTADSADRKAAQG
ncbi:dTDP-4-dehydrorhamnose reductase [Streptomyces sp. CBMA152]|uniref:dTDP-4-dehydrorhamnose reductase n=1 Tax=Streptomyces sp. CBMA152 TaxID=1896312 RepID=UPI001CB75390|nr:dTDP-4-dehydrorhamnose reductase [Streptomyces sp. CBMA152]